MYHGFTPKEMADILGMDYFEVLDEFKRSGLAFKIGRRWYLPDPHVYLYLNWDPSTPPPNPVVFL